MWYDRWTPGNTGNIIHIVYIDTGSDDVWYDTFDTSTDTNGTEVAMDTTSRNVMTNADNSTISRGTDGDLYIGFCNGSTAASCNVKKCTDTCTTAGNWTGTGTSPLDAANDYIRLFPLANGNMMIIRHDISADDIQSRTYTDSTNSWAGSWNNIDINAAENTTYPETLVGVVDINTNDIYLAYGASVAVANQADIRTAVYDGSTWATKTDVVTDVNTMISLDIGYDLYNDRVFVAYIQGTAGSNTTVYYKNSSDGMTSWSTAQQINTITGDIRYVYLNQSTYDIIYTTYYRNTSSTDGLHGYTIEILSKAPNPPLIPYANNDDAQSGQVSPVYKLIDLTPAFSAIYEDDNINDTATYYEIEVGTNPDWFIVETWSSGKIAISSCTNGNRCSDITYSGPTLSNGVTYYWRILFWDNYGKQGIWSDTQQFSINGYPTVTNVTVNNSANISLNENSTTSINWTAFVTDVDGYDDIDITTGKIYRSGVTNVNDCTDNDLNCYSDNACSLSNCSGTTCTVTCSANIYFFADATDSNSDYPSEFWLGWIKAIDQQNYDSEDFSPTDVTDLESLTALQVDSNISFGTLFAGENTGSTNQSTLITNTGNSPIDAELYGTNMCKDYPTCTGTQIPVDNMKYSNSSFNYNTEGTVLTDTANLLQLNISKPNTSPSNSSGTIHWGILLPYILETGTYLGENTILATLDI